MTSIDPESLLARARGAAERAFVDSPVQCAYVFGSRVTGGARPDSDLDVAVLLGSDVAPEERGKLSLELAGRLQHELGPSPLVEALVVLDDAPIALAGRILRDGRVIHSADDVARVRHFSETMRRFGDWDIKARVHAQERLRAMASNDG